MNLAKTLKIDDVKIQKIQIKENGQLLATADMEYLGLVVHGFRIMRTDKFDKDIAYNLWIQVPVVQAYGRYIDLIRILDKNSWKELKVKIFREYQIANDKFYRQKFNEPTTTPAVSVDQEPNIEPEVNVDDIKF